jgi:hypothetical protein
MKDYIGAEAISLLLAIGYIRCPRGKGQDTVRRDEKTKSVVKVSSQRTTNQPPSKQTNQPVKNKKSVGPRVGLVTFFLRA